MSNPRPQLVQTSHTPSTLDSWNEPRKVKDDSGRMLSAIDQLFLRFDAMYMQKWRSFFTSTLVTEDWKKMWSHAFISNGITAKMAFSAIERCAKEYPKWPPTEGEFIALCRPEIDYEQAFHDAVRQMHKRMQNDPDDRDFWPIPAIYWAALEFGQFELRTVSYSQAAGKWKRLLDKWREADCPDVKSFVPQIAAPARDDAGVAITSVEAKATAMRAMASLAGRVPSREVAISKAREILRRHAAGEPITYTQVKFAKEALSRLGADEDAATHEEE